MLQSRVFPILLLLALVGPPVGASSFGLGFPHFDSPPQGAVIVNPTPSGSETGNPGALLSGAMAADDGVQARIYAGSTRLSPNVLTQKELSSFSIDVGIEPTYETYDPGNGYVYVANYGSSNVSVINGTTAVGTIHVGIEPDDVTYDSGNGYVYVPNQGSGMGAGIVSIINGTRVIGSVTVGIDPYSSLYDSRNGYVYVPNYFDDNVSVINGTKVLTSVSVGNVPAFAVYDPARGYVDVINDGSSTVSVINGTTVVQTVNVGNGPLRATYDGGNGYVYVANLGADTVSIIDGTTNVGTVGVGADPESATYDTGNGYVYVPNYDSNNVTVIDGVKVVGSIAVGAGPEFGTSDSGNGYVYISNSNVGSMTPGNVSVINGTELVGSVNVGINPWSSVFDNGNGYVYVPNYGSNNVSVLMVSYKVAFNEVGLPSGTGWWVNVTGGPSTLSRSSTLSFSEFYGTYWYSVSTTNKTYSPSAMASSFTINGTSASQSVVFSPVTYPVTFAEAGLPNGTNWSVTLGGVNHFSNTTTIDFQEPNGTHTYTIGAVPGWRAGSYTGSITVHGGTASTSISWLHVTYAVNFTESGLPSSTEWWVNASSGSSTPSVAPTLSVLEPNGTYTYSVATLDKTFASHGGSFSVDGSNASEAVVFYAVNYTITFAASGLPSGAGWWVNVTGGSPTFSTTDSLSFEESNGTYPYSVSATNANYSSPDGSLAVKGAAVSKTLAFALTAFPGDIHGEWASCRNELVGDLPWRDGVRDREPRVHNGPERNLLVHRRPRGRVHPESHLWLGRGPWLVRLPVNLVRPCGASARQRDESDNVLGSPRDGRVRSARRGHHRHPRGDHDRGPDSEAGRETTRWLREGPRAAGCWRSSRANLSGLPESVALGIRRVRSWAARPICTQRVL